MGNMSKFIKLYTDLCILLYVPQYKKLKRKKKSGNPSVYLTGSIFHTELA